MSDPIAQVRNQFSTLIVDGDESTALALRDLVTSFGYTEVRVTAGLNEGLNEARSNPPHLVLFGFEGFENEAEDFLKLLQDTSGETLSILLAREDQLIAALQTVAGGLAYDVVTRPFASSLELLQTMDRAAQRLYYQFESEQLRESLATASVASPPPPAIEPPDIAPAIELPPPIPSPVSTAASDPLADFVERLAKTRDLEETIDTFIGALADDLDAPVLYFKYLSSHDSLLLAHAARLPLEKFRGVGIDLRKEGTAPDALGDPSSIAALRDLVRGLFNKPRFLAIPHFDEGAAVGVVVVLGDVPIASSRTSTMWKIFEMAWKRNSTLRQVHTLDVFDAATGLVDRRHFTQRLDEEISRARRIHLPVTLITIAVDRFDDIVRKLGSQPADAILRVLAQLLKKTARVSDVIGRTGPSEFSCLLPHTAARGGAIKAERIRRLVEATKFPLLGGGSVTVSSGVSEFPSLASDGDAVTRSAEEALAQMIAVGGGRVCLATPVPGHKLDFVPREVPQSGDDS